MLFDRRGLYGKSDKRDADMRGEKKIDLMHRMFGEAEGKCVGCRHFVRYTYRDRTYSKCKYYGMSHSEATDWSGRNQACGLINRKFSELTRSEILIARGTQARKELDENIPGQMTLDDLWG